MTTNQVAHTGEQGYAYYYGYSGKITLNDPNAIGNFFDEMIKHAQTILPMYINQAIQVVGSAQQVARNMQQNLINYVVVRRT